MHVHQKIFLSIIYDNWNESCTKSTATMNRLGFNRMVIHLRLTVFNRSSFDSIWVGGGQMIFIKEEY